MATPSLAMIPSAYADSKVYSVLPNNGDGDFTFNRDSSATRVGQNGLIQTVGFFGNELVTNGSFDTDSDWTKGSGWTISGGKANYDGVASIGDLSQSISFSAGKVYKYTFTISSLTQGGVRVFVGNTVGATHSSNGTFVGYITYSSGGSTILQARSSFIGSIDNVSIVEVTGDQPRLNYDISNGVVQSCPSLLLEPASTNLLPYSEDYSQSVWGKTNVTLTSNAVVSPDGTQNASKIVATGTDSSLQDSITVTSGTTYTLSVYLKTVSGTLDTAISLGSPGFPQNEGEGGRYKNITVTNEWKRYTLTSTADASAATGIGVGGFNSFSTGEQVYVYGAQLEAQSYPTSYIPTNGSSQTRAAESCIDAGNAATFNSTEGVLYAEISALADDGTFRLFSISDGTNNNRITIGFSNTSNKFYFQLKANNSSIWQELITKNVIDTHKIAFKYKSGQQSVFVNGLEVVTKTNSFTFSSNLNDLSFFEQGTSNAFYGNVKDIRVYNEALTDAQLQTLTT